MLPTAWAKISNYRKKEISLSSHFFRLYMVLWSGGAFWLGIWGFNVWFRLFMVLWLGLGVGYFGSQHLGAEFLQVQVVAMRAMQILACVCVL